MTIRAYVAIDPDDPPADGERLAYDASTGKWTSDKKRWVPVTTDHDGDGVHELLFTDGGDVVVMEVQD